VGEIPNLIFIPEKALLCPLYFACGGLYIYGTCGLDKEAKIRNFHASHWLFAQITHVDTGF